MTPTAEKVKRKKSLLAGLRKKFDGNYESATPKPSERLRLSGKKLRIAFQGMPFVVEMGKQTLHICPDLAVDKDARKPPHDFIVFDPKLYYTGIAQTLRLAPEEKLAIDHREESQKHVFSRPRHAFRRHLQITHKGDALIFRDPISELGTYVSVLPEEQDKSRFEMHRLRNVESIIRLFGGPIEPLSPADALDTLKRVNQLLQEDPYRRMDSFGNAGGVVELPGHVTPIIVGDLHAQLNNLLKILSENS
jgi:hypothetical protein